MLIINGKQYIEGIDGIDLLIQPYLYPYLNNTKQLDPYKKISIYTTIGKFPNSNGGFTNKYFYYLHISGEYIDHELPIKFSITRAIAMMFYKGIINIIDNKDEAELNVINDDIIINHLDYFVTGISGIEFCFDFDSNNISIADDSKVIDTTDSGFPLFLNNKLKDRQDYLIREGNSTYYSNDYNKRRKSTLKLYNRETWLLKKNNEYSEDFIKNNPFKIRIEFVLKNKYNSSYLTFNNLEGNYKDIINKFIPYLAKLYKKYFLGKIMVYDLDLYKYFFLIYNLAHTDKLPKITLENRTKIHNDNTNIFKLINVLRKEKRNKIKSFEELNDLYYAFNMNNSKQNILTPMSIIDKDKIDFIDGEFVFLKDNIMLPKYNIIKKEDDN